MLKSAINKLTKLNKPKLAMQFQTISVSGNNQTMRLDSFISIKTDMSRSQIQRLIKSGNIKINGKIVKKTGQTINEGDEITIRKPKPISTDIKAEDIKLEIIFEDKNILVINKPAGMVVHPDKTGHLRGTVVNAALHHIKDLGGIGGSLRPGIVHRLDKDTSGALVIAKNDKTHKKLSNSFHDRKVEKKYLALVYGTPKTKTGSIIASIKRSTKDRKKMGIDETGKEAFSSFKLIHSYGAYALLEVSIKTGRTHQIRVHMASIGHPIIGDDKYGNKKLNDEFEKKYGLKRQFLHSSVLKINGKKFTAELPQDLTDIITQLENQSSL